MSEHVRHILSMSGGKDSTALAVYMRDRQPDMEYVFCDTKKELKETYDYLWEGRGVSGQADHPAERRARFRPLAGGVRELPAVPADAVVHTSAQDPSVRAIRRR